jgi:ABC-type transport system involved in multi-copper enzyme maturation permease subunit
MSIYTLARLTIRETQRRRILWIGALMGIAFLLIFGLGFHFIYQDITRNMSGEAVLIPLRFLTLAGIYATNFLVVIVAVLISVATISGEIESHTIESLLTKPIQRWQLLAGKWLGYATIILLFVLLLPGGVMLIVYLRSGFVLSNMLAGLALIYLEGLVALSVSMTGGTRLSTLANGALAFMLFGIAFIGGWVEQIGAILRNETAVDVGIFTSLIMPTEVLWKKASTLFEPEIVSGFEVAGPFGVSSQPSDLMIVYSVIYIFLLMLLALWLFKTRDI